MTQDAVPAPETAPADGPLGLTDFYPAMGFLAAFFLPGLASLPLQWMLVLRLTGLDLYAASGSPRDAMGQWLATGPAWQLSLVLLALSLGSVLLGLPLLRAALHHDGKPRPVPYPHAWFLAYVAASSAAVALATLTLPVAPGSGNAWALAALLNLALSAGGGVLAGTLVGWRASLRAKAAENRYRSGHGMKPVDWSAPYTEDEG